MQKVEHHVAELFNLLSEAYDIPEKEVQIVADSVARYGVQMLPGNIVTEVEDDGGETPAEARISQDG